MMAQTFFIAGKYIGALLLDTLSLKLYAFSWTSIEGMARYAVQLLLVGWLHWPIIIKTVRPRLNAPFIRSLMKKKKKKKLSRKAST